MAFSFGGSTAPAFGATAATTSTTFGGTSSTPAFGGFGAPASTPSFGAPATNIPAFGATATTTPAFGAPATTAPAFGAPATATPAFGTFGAPSAAPAFGAPTASSTPAFGAPASTTTTTFGATPGFGATTFNAPSMPAFGATTWGTPATTFGASTTAAPALGASTTLSLGASSTPAFGTSTFGAPGSTFGASPALGAPSTPGFGALTTTTAVPVTGTTKYGDLPDAHKKILEQMRKTMNEQKSLSEEIGSRSSNQKLAQLGDDVDDLIQRAKSLCATLNSDKDAIVEFKKKIGTFVKTAEDAYYSIQRLKSSSYIQPQQLPSQYFWKVLDSLDNRSQQCKNVMNEIERYLQTSLEHKSFDAARLQELMRHQYEVFIKIAADVAAVHESVNIQRENFLAYRKKHFNDTTNPFAEQKKPQNSTPRPATSFALLAAPSTPQLPATPSTSFFNTPTTTTPTITFPALGVPSATGTPISGSNLFSIATTPSTPLTTNTFGATPASSVGSSFATPSISTFGTTTSSLFNTPVASTPTTTLTPAFGSFASPAASSSPSLGKKALSTSTSSTTQGRRKARNSK